MCKAFSCIISRSGKVTWKWAKDEHESLIQLAGYKDETMEKDKLEFARVEISPNNGNWLEPDTFELKIDEKIKPTWFTEEYKKKCFQAFEKWQKKLDTILVRKKIIQPFKDIEPPKEITKNHKELLKVWASVWDSVGGSVCDSVGVSVCDSVKASVGDSVGDSVWDSVGGSVWTSVGDSVGAPIGAYIGSFFKLKRSEWKYTKKIKTKGYPFQPVVDLWEQGLVPSFNGKIWRLHGGKNAKVLYEISKEELRK